MTIPIGVVKKHDLILHKEDPKVAHNFKGKLTVHKKGAKVSLAHSSRFRSPKISPRKIEQMSE